MRCSSLLTKRAGLIVLGGAPFEDTVVTWWHSVGRTRDDIVEARRDSQAQGDRFGQLPEYSGVSPRLASPKVPPVRLMSRLR